MRDYEHKLEQCYSRPNTTCLVTADGLGETEETENKCSQTYTAIASAMAFSPSFTKAPVCNGLKIRKRRQNWSFTIRTQFLTSAALGEVRATDSKQWEGWDHCRADCQELVEERRVGVGTGEGWVFENNIPTGKISGEVNTNGPSVYTKVLNSHFHQIIQVKMLKWVYFKKD